MGSVFFKRSGEERRKRRRTGEHPKQVKLEMVNNLFPKDRARDTLTHARAARAR